MTKIRLKISCGCREGMGGAEGAVTELTQVPVIRAVATAIRDALQHAATTGHTLEIRGEIRAGP